MRANTRNRKLALFAKCLLALPLLAFLSPQANPVDPTRPPSQYGHAMWRIQEGYLPGLPEVVVQTTDGYLWIGTYAGLVRFDGVRFVPWASLNDKPLPDYRIYSLLATEDGSLWIGTGNGLARWKAGELTNFGKPGGRINAILEDLDRNVWIARSQIPDHGGPLCRVSGNDPRCFGQADGIPLPTAMRLAKDNSGSILIGGSEGLCRWKPGSSSTTYFQKELKQHGMLLGVIAIAAARNGDLWVSLEQSAGSLELEHFVDGNWKPQALPGVRDSDQGVSTLFADRDGALWVGTAKRGVYRIYNGRTDHYASADGLSSDAIAGFFQDREGTLWVASSKGIDSFRDLPVITYSLKEGLSGDSVSTVFAARDGTVWIGNSGTLDFLKGNQLSSIRTNHGLPGRDVTTMFEDHAGRLWLGIDSGLFVRDHEVIRPVRDPDGAALGIVYGITEDTKNNVWVRASNKLVRIQDLSVRQALDQAPISQSFAIAADPVNGIWLGFTNGDLARYRNDRLELIPADANLSTARIRKLLPESDGSVWAVTEKGLVWWKDQKHLILSTQSGLPCDELYTAVKDTRGKLWLFSRCGLFSIDPSQIKVWQSHPSSHVAVDMFDVFDGVQPGITPLQPQGSRSPDGRLWFANDSVLQMLDPRSVPRNSLAPNVLVERIVADGTTYSPKDDFRLPALTRNLEIDYTALSFVVPQKVRFRYQLEGHDTGWQDAQLRRQAFYSDLPPGKYRFRVMACNNDDVWNEVGSALEFNLAPTFFQTNWFFALCGAAVVGILWLFYLLRMRQLASEIRAGMEARQGERERIARELHDTLLQSVQGLILRFHGIAKQMPAQSPARESMDRTLDRAESALAEGRDRVLHLRASAGNPNDLADAFRVAAEESFQGGSPSLKVVVEGNPRTLHPLVREEVFAIGREAIVNALRHSNSTHVEVEITYDSRELRLRIRDDGCGVDPQVLKAGGRQGHWGLKGMRERAKSIGARLEIWSRSGSGTEIELSVPAIRAYPAVDTGARWLWLRGVLGRNR
jgi:signal transduction histidine kinase/ligand-binding sensor domain-containing protein